MKPFLSGFLAALVIGVGLLWAQGHGYLDIFTQEAAPTAIAPAPAVPLQEPGPAPREKKAKRGRRRARAAAAAAKGYQDGDGVAGDDLGQGASAVDGASRGGEEQLSNAQIEQGIDRIFGGIERCLVLMPADAPSSGRVVIGMGIAPGGTVTRVNLSGTKTMISGECGACIQRLVRSLRFPPFDGPEMIVRYPVSFD
ncbi:MAG TPA: AgmX/PglI C-terminal domain-containing protein [Polyangia bacterium]|nr:AgmX/PglI C-terminal domain-containing protein [Polyangia bacterium]